MEKNYDLIVVGSGAAGLSTAYEIRQAGKSVAVIDDRPYGGTCANRGCDPKKVLIGAAEVLDWTARMHGKGVDDNSKINWAELMAFKGTFTDERPKNTLDGLKHAGIDAYSGVAGFVGENKMQVGEHILTAKHIMIASGAVPMPLNIEGEQFVTFSDEFMELKELPKEIVFIGGGFISFEFAHLAARAGANVHILERGERPLKNFDADMVDVLYKKSLDIGIKIHLKTEVNRIEKDGDTFMVYGTQNGKEIACPAGLVVHGAGRIPALAAMDLDKGNVQQSRNGVVVNQYMQSVSNKIVYAAGDVADTGGLPLTPIASIEGYVAAENILGGKTKPIDYRVTPSVVFSIPKVALVGLHEAQAKDMGKDFYVKTYDTSGWNTSRRTNDNYSKVKVLIENGTSMIIGAHAVGNAADELINLFALAISFSIPADKLKAMVFAYPTVASDLKYML